MPLAPLPIDDVLPELTGRLQNASAAVLRAPTGSGKTTRVPPALLDTGLADSGAIVVLEPRRIAARAAARRIAFERSVDLGTTVGYQVRFDQQISRDTQIRIVTDGILLRLLQDDPYLERVSAVVFDEFHERGLNVDLALAMVRRIQQTVRPDLKIIVMSATLDPAPIAAWLGDCPIVLAEGKLFPVEIEYLGVGKLFSPRVSGPARTAAFPPARGGEGGLARAVEATVARTSGHILVFLPGVGEIRRAADELQPLATKHELAVLPLYGDLPPERQDAVLAPSDRRKLILATNVAETSLTIDGVTAVIDSGQARMLRFDEHVGLDRLELSRISQASADQRAGRAGRTADGLCLRLWSERDHNGLTERDTPEIHRVDLAGAVLQLRAWGESDIIGFPWFEPPRQTLVAQAEELLERLGAVDQAGITPLGRQMARAPVHPRLARLLLEGDRLGIRDRAALAAALLAERDPFIRGTGTPGIARSRKAVHQSESDVLDRVIALEDFERSGRVAHSAGTLHEGGARNVLRARDQLAGVSSASPSPVNRQIELEHDPHDQSERFCRAILAAFPDRVARRRDSNRDRGVMVGGRGVRFALESAVGAAELLVCVDVDAGTGEALVRQASAVARNWLDPRLVVTRDVVSFDPRSERAKALRQTCYEDLVLDEVALSHVPDEELAAALAAAAAGEFDRVVPRTGDARDFIERVQSLREWMPELHLPPLDDTRLKELLPVLTASCRTLADLRRADWLGAIRNLLSFEQRQIVEREAPERLSVPSGNRVAIRYEAGRRPILAVRIQELFGLAETPRIAGGRVPLLLHLLAPNMRPQQVTDDLKSFWNNTYQVVRKELRVRYPKHSWPEDPWNAPPQRKPGARVK